MKQAHVVVDKKYYVSVIEKELFGSFIEHLGRAVYSGIYEPTHPYADKNGFRRDVIDCVKDLNISIVRYPGGNFVSGYDWTDGIGPKEQRPRRLDLAWRSIETNQCGVDEFADWASDAGVEIMMAVNLGTGTPKEAGNIVEYCNHPSGTFWSDLRIENGHKEPHSIHTWCLGNEMDGPWQICQMSADEYGKKAREAAKIMRWVDPTIKLVACGSSTTEIDTYPDWDRIVLEHVYEHVDYLSLHKYYEDRGNTADFLASFYDMDCFIKTISGVLDYVKAKKRSSKKVYLSFDEWNIWYQKNQKEHDWEVAPPILEDNYSLLDALVFGGLLCTLLNNSDRVKMACLAQLVNVIAPIMTEPGGTFYKQTIYYPFQQVAQYGNGKVLKTLFSSPSTETKTYGEVPLVQASVIYDEDNGRLAIFALNTDQEESIEFKIDLRSFDQLKFEEHSVLRGDDLNAKNSFDHPEKVIPVRAKYVPDEVARGTYSITLSRLSWNMICFSVIE